MRGQNKDWANIVHFTVPGEVDLFLGFLSKIKVFPKCPFCLECDIFPDFVMLNRTFYYLSEVVRINKYYQNGYHLTLNTSAKNPTPNFSLMKSSIRVKADTACLIA